VLVEIHQLARLVRLNVGLDPVSRGNARDSARPDEDGVTLPEPCYSVPSGGEIRTIRVEIGGGFGVAYSTLEHLVRRAGSSKDQVPRTMTSHRQF